MLRASWIISLTIFAAFAVACGGGKISNKSAPPAEQTKEHKQLQAKRKEAVDELMKRGVFKRASKDAGSDHAMVVVTPLFMALDYDTKLVAVLAVTNWLFDVPKDGQIESSQMVILTHSITGKTVGDFTAAAGLQME